MDPLEFGIWLRGKGELAGWIYKMKPEDDPEAFINNFERVALAAGWKLSKKP